MTINTVLLSPETKAMRREKLSGAVISPTMLLDVSSGEIVPHATADAKPAILRIADINVGSAGDIDTDYADGEIVNYVEGMSNGEYVAVTIAASQTIAAGGELASNGAGLLKSPAVAGTGVIYIADEAVTTGVGETAIIRAQVAV